MQKLETQAPSMNDIKGMELSVKTTIDQKTAQLPLEPGKASPLPHRDGEKVVSERILRLANEIVSLTIFEVADLNNMLKKKLNLPDVPVFAQSFATPAAGKSSCHKVVNFQYKECQCFLKTFSSFTSETFS